MKNIYFLILACLQIWQVQAQQKKLKLEDIKRFVFIDSQNWDYRLSYTTEYEVVQKRGVWKQYITKQTVKGKTFYDRKPKFKNSKKRVFVTNIPKDTLQKFIDIFNSLKLNESCTLEDFGINQNWIDEYKYKIYNNAITFWEKKEKETADVIKKQEKSILDYLSKESTYYDVLIRNTSWWTNDYPICAIRLDLYSKDTIHLVTRSQHKQMPKWTVFKKMGDMNKNYDAFCSPNLSNWLSNRLLYFDGWSNKRRLSGDKFLLDDMEIGGMNIRMLALSLDYYEKNKKTDSVKKMIEKVDISAYFDKKTIEDWEKEWEVLFSKDENLQMRIRAKNTILKIYTEVVANSKSEVLKQWIDTLQKNIKDIMQLPILGRYKDEILEIKIHRNAEKINDTIKTNYKMEKQFGDIFILYRQYCDLYMNKGVRKLIPNSYEYLELPFIFLIITEKNNSKSYWVLEKNGTLILWKFDENSVFKELDKNKKAFKKYSSDNEYILLEKIE